jgi:hypothetical protein
LLSCRPSELLVCKPIDMPPAVYSSLDQCRTSLKNRLASAPRGEIVGRWATKADKRVRVSVAIIVVPVVVMPVVVVRAILRLVIRVAVITATVHAANQCSGDKPAWEGVVISAVSAISWPIVEG